jgi:DNA polymerase (family X)
MTVHNAEIADILNKFADLLAIEGANPYRVRAYQSVARNIEALSTSVGQMVERDEDLTTIPGIGKDLAAKVEEIVRTGTLKDLEEVGQRVPMELIDLTSLAGLGPKRVGTLYRELGVATLEGLEKAARAGQVRQLEGFGAKMAQKIIEELEQTKGESSTKRFKLMVAEQVVEPLMDYLRNIKGVIRAEAAGSYRRMKETVGDLDILVVCGDDSDVMQRFVEYERVDRVLSKGTTRSTVVLRSGLQVDLRAVPDKSYGAALQYFTGSKAHGVATRRVAQEKGLKLNEYGVFRGSEQVAGKTEEEVYSQLALPWIDPEIRENMGEIEAAQEGRLPQLVTLADIRGDLHAHTKATDGRATLEEMARAARKRGYKYLAITDHTARLKVAKGMDSERLAKQIEEIDRLNEKLDAIAILKGAEVDILEDGSLDLPDEILRQLDLVVCSVHYKFDLPKEQQTRRIIKAMDHPCFTIVGHPTGRLINQREPYDVDMEHLMRAALDTGSALELEAADVLNTRSLRDLKKLLRKR